MKTVFIPKLVQNVSLTLGLSDEEYSVLKNCSEGDKTISDIVALTNLPWNLVVEILKRYERKGWIKIDYEGDEPEFQPLSIKKFPETAVKLGMISKKKYDINLLCDGKRTIKEISDELGISLQETKEILKDMEKNKIVVIYPKIPLKEEAPKEKAQEISKRIYLQPVCVKNLTLFSDVSEDIKKILQLCNGENTIETIYQQLNLPLSKIIRTIIEYEEKGWVTLKLNQYLKLVELKNKIRNISDEKTIKKIYEDLFGPIEEFSESIVKEMEVSIDNIAEREVIRVKIKSELPKLPSPVINIILDKIFQLPTPTEREKLLEMILNSKNAEKFKFTSVSESPSQVPQVMSVEQPQIISDEIPTPIEITEEDQEYQKLNKILEIINELGAQIPNSIISLIDVEDNGNILYQTKEWNVSNDIKNFIEDWKNASPSIEIDGIKYATIKTNQNDIFIGTNVQGYGHILAKYINPGIFILIKMPKEQDPLDVEDVLPHYISRIYNILTS